MTFAGLGRAASGKETVIVSAFTGNDHICTLSSWGSVAADLTVTIQRFTAAGALVDGRFEVVVVE